VHKGVVTRRVQQQQRNTAEKVLAAHLSHGREEHAEYSEVYQTRWSSRAIYVWCLFRWARCGLASVAARPESFGIAPVGGYVSTTPNSELRKHSFGIPMSASPIFATALCSDANTNYLLPLVTQAIVHDDCSAPRRSTSTYSGRASPPKGRADYPMITCAATSCSMAQLNVIILIGCQNNTSIL
jgi:hypothetical protein